MNKVDSEGTDEEQITYRLHDEGNYIGSKKEQQTVLLCIPGH